MSVRVKVIRQMMPICGVTERLVTTFGEADSDRSLSEFFTLFLPFLSSTICNYVAFPNECVCQRKMVIIMDYGDKDLSELRNEVEK